METRKIIIVDSSTNQKVVVNTNATTFGELKRAASAAGINCEGKDWLEGITKTTPIGDDSLLPTNVVYHDTVTNNLVYMLTDTNKKIKNGIDRSGIYSEIKNLNIAAAINTKYGRNFTQICSETLLAEINRAKTAAARNAAAPATPVNADKYEAAVNALAKVVALIPDNILNDVLAAARKLVAHDIVLSDEDIEALFN